MKKKSIIIILTIILSFLILNLISAEVTEDNYFRYGTIDPNGNLNTTTTPVNNVNVVGFICSSSMCSTVSGRLWPGVLTSTNDYIKLTYPTVLQSTEGYGIIMYKDGYIPYGVSADWAGNGTAPGSPFYNYLTKKQICGPRVLSETVTNNCRTINTVATIRAPISKAGLINYYPPEIINQFTSNVDVTFEVRKDNNLVYTETKRISLIFSEEKDVSFSYTPTDFGTYTSKIIATTDESRCLTKSTDQKDSQITIPACCLDSDCGTNGLTGNPFCTNNDLFQNFITYTCNNPGQANAYCSNSTCNQLKQDCGDNSCQNWNNVCKNNNVYKQRTCTNQGCSANSCFSTNSTEEQIVEVCSNGCSNGSCNPVTITCNSDSDCGTNGFSGNPFCTNNDLFQNYLTYTCNNPGTSQSYCSNSTCNQLKQDCGDNSCQNWNNICKNNNVYKTRTCTNQGCSANSCFSTNSTEEQIVEICSNGCLNGACNPINITCSVNSDCGTNGFTGNPFCTNDDLFQNFITYTCNNPGQSNSFCSNSTNSQLKQNCDYKCENNKCIEHHGGTNPCDISGNPNCPTEEKPPINQVQDISYAFINDTIQKLQKKNDVKCKYFCNNTWLWILIIIALLLLILLIIAFILWVIGSRKKRRNNPRK